MFSSSISLSVYTFKLWWEKSCLMLISSNLTESGGSFLSSISLPLLAPSGRENPTISPLSSKSGLRIPSASVWSYWLLSFYEPIVGKAFNGILGLLTSTRINLLNCP